MMTVEPPSWKQELLKKKKSKQSTVSNEESSVRSNSTDNGSFNPLPEWKRELLLRKKQQTDAPSSTNQTGVFTITSTRRQRPYSAHEPIRNGPRLTHQDGSTYNDLMHSSGSGTIVQSNMQTKPSGVYLATVSAPAVNHMHDEAMVSEESLCSAKDNPFLRRDGGALARYPRIHHQVKQHPTRKADEQLHPASVREKAVENISAKLAPFLKSTNVIIRSGDDVINSKPDSTFQPINHSAQFNDGSSVNSLDSELPPPNLVANLSSLFEPADSMRHFTPRPFKVRDPTPPPSAFRRSLSSESTDGPLTLQPKPLVREVKMAKPQITSAKSAQHHSLTRVTPISRVVPKFANMTGIDKYMVRPFIKDSHDKQNYYTKNLSKVAAMLIHESNSFDMRFVGIMNKFPTKSAVFNQVPVKRTPVNSGSKPKLNSTADNGSASDSYDASSELFTTSSEQMSSQRRVLPPPTTLLVDDPTNPQITVFKQAAANFAFSPTSENQVKHTERLDSKNGETIYVIGGNVLARKSSFLSPSNMGRKRNIMFDESPRVIEYEAFFSDDDSPPTPVEYKTEPAPLAAEEEDLELSPSPTSYHRGNLSDYITSQAEPSQDVAISSPDSGVPDDEDVRVIDDDDVKSALLF